LNYYLPNDYGYMVAEIWEAEGSRGVRKRYHTATYIVVPGDSSPAVDPLGLALPN